MAGTMAFYNGMAPGITQLVSSLAGDEAARKGYAKAATAEHDIASARRANVEARIKQQEYDDTDKNALSYVSGQHGISIPDFQQYHRQQSGKLEPGADARTYSPEEAAKYNAALRDYGAFRTGKFSDVSKGATEFAQLPAVQQAVRSAADIAARPGVTAEDSMRAARGATNGTVSLDQPTDVREAQWLADPRTTPAQRKAHFENKAAGRSPGVSINNFPGGFKDIVDQTTGKVNTVQIAPSGQQRVVGEAPQPSPSMSQLIARKAAAALTPPAAAPGAPAVQSSQPPGIPAGAKKVGTSKGKPVYEINGKRFIAE